MKEGKGKGSHLEPPHSGDLFCQGESTAKKFRVNRENKFSRALVTKHKKAQLDGILLGSMKHGGGIGQRENSSKAKEGSGRRFNGKNEGGAYKASM